MFLPAYMDTCQFNCARKLTARGNLNCVHKRLLELLQGEFSPHLSVNGGFCGERAKIFRLCSDCNVVVT